MLPLPPNATVQYAAGRLRSKLVMMMIDIWEEHFSATELRCRHCRTILAVQDTTVVDYSGLTISTRGERSGRKIPAHVSLAVGGGRSLGLLKIENDFRAAVPTGSKRRRMESARLRWLRGLDWAQQLGRACPDSRIISVCAREGDFWDMYATQASNPEAAGLVVRTCASKRHQVIAEGESCDLNSHMTRQEPVGWQTIDIPARARIVAGRGKMARARRPKRTVKLQLRVARIVLKAPGRRRKTLPLLAVLASEPTTPPKGAKRLHWLLLSTDGTADRSGAELVLERYAGTWAIEEYFRAFKRAARSKNRFFGEPDDLRKCLTNDALFSWRIFDILRAAKDEPDRLALDFFAQDELVTLYFCMENVGFNDVSQSLSADLSIRQAAIDVGRYSGFLPSKLQPLPGPEKMRQSMTKLEPAVFMYRALKEENPFDSSDSQ